MSLQLPKSLLKFPREKLANPVLQERIDADGITDIELDFHYTGRFLIRFDAVDEITLRAVGNKSLFPDQFERLGNRLIIRGRNLSSVIRSIFDVDFIMELHLPKHLNLTMNFFAGSTVLFGGTGALSIKGAFGEVAGLSYSTDAEVRISCGTVALIELKGLADIRVGIGSSEIGLSKTNGDEQLRVRIGVGSVEFTVNPADAPESDHGGFFKEKLIVMPSGSKIDANVGVGSIETTYG